MKRTALFLSLFLILFPLFSAERFALKAKRVVTVSGAPMEGGVLLINKGRIERVLSYQDPLPEGYPLVEFKEGTVYPGLINLYSSLGITGVGWGSVWNDSKEVGNLNPQLSTFSAFYPWSNLLPIVRSFGTLTVLVAPNGGAVSGRASLMKTSGWNPDEMVLERDAALIVQLIDKRPAREKETMAPAPSKRTKEVREFLQASRVYSLRACAGEKQAYSPLYEATRFLWEKKRPLIFAANTVEEIREAIKISQEFAIPGILLGAYEGEKLLPEIRLSGLPVILSSLYEGNHKWEEGYDMVYRLPGLLEKSEIPFAFSFYSSANAFDFPVQAGRAVAYGLSREGAVKALTMTPARIMGLKDRGSIDVGSWADLIVLDGDLLEGTTKVLAVFCEGKRIQGMDYFQREAERASRRESGE